MWLKNSLPAILWAILIAVLCGMPGKDIPHISFLELLEFDKFVHAFLFFVLLVLLVRSFKSFNQSLFISKNALLFAFLFSVSYGVLMEWMQQTFFKDRTADVYDIIANSFGSSMAIFYLLYLKKII